MGSLWNRARAAFVLGLLPGCGPGAVYGTGGGTGSGGNPPDPTAPTATITASSTSGPDTDGDPSSGTTSGGSTTTTTGPVEPPPLPDIPGDLPPVCVDEVVEGRFLRPQIVLVLDQASSMNVEWTFQGQMMTRWNTLSLVVQDVLTEFDDRADFGAELFPGLELSCIADDPITVPVAKKNAANVLAGIPAPQATTSGSTPLGGGVDVSLDHLAQIAGLAPQALILMADGGVSWACPGPNHQDEVTAMLSGAFAAGIPTYVVGIGGEYFSDLEQFAVAGGVPKSPEEAVYNADDGDILLATLEEIVQEVIGCAVEIGKTPANPELLEVEIDGTPFPRVADCANEDGWVYGDTFETLELCGSACTALEQSGIIDIHLVCP